MTSTAAPATPEQAGIWRVVPALVLAIAAGWFATFLPLIAQGEYAEFVVPWIPSLNIELAFRLDALSLTFALLITGIGAICFLYASTYFRSDPRLKRLLSLLTLFAISMLGLVLADDAITLFVFWEGTTITSFLLVGYDHHKKSARDSALQALLVTGLGGLALLAGLILMGQVAGTYRISEWVQMGGIFRDSGLYLGMLTLVLLGCFTKSAQFPFHFWLPGAMAAPTPVSAYLHSATMVKAGVYLIARLSPALGGTEVWTWTLTLVGATTMIVASIWALKQTDLKLMLAYTTVMALGALVMFLGGDYYYATTGAVTFIIVHALYKATLFLSVGMLDKMAGTREVEALGGLRRAMPLTWGIILLAAASMAGFLPFFGFIGKELKYEGALGVASEPLLVASAAVLANALMVAAAGMVALKPFLGAQRSPKPAPSDPPMTMWIGPALLAVMGLTFGLFPDLIGPTLILPMAEVVYGGPVPVEVKLWAGVNTALKLSIATFLLGFVFYWMLSRIRQSLDKEVPRVADAAEGYEILLQGMKDLAAWTARTIQPGKMTSYLRYTFLLMGVLVWGAILIGTGGIDLELGDVPIFHSAIVAIIAVSTFAIVVTGSRLVAITALGGVGAGLAVIFVLYSAIDVALTQLLVEILVVVFIAVALLKLPRAGTGRLRIGDASISVMLGLGVTFGLMAVMSTPLDRTIPDYFEAVSYSEAFGRNIVNVILVDFRALDTLGEIAVVVIAAVAAVAALRGGGQEVEK
ncbi:multicomponent Na+:H+ antiporter subunit A [Rubricella aquisinus]|uniref:Multicomponent Na+:H+ antiporter subunit A n=1 Tax=Rubricella aquisinus TaxID=2028108 RepID=A0A840WLS5_9RHOB|nr:hydrogen gas-evolving membrane-bound hydrogenase subunit E [Rubricella aquisinus]MBB5514602.1 multicomponent Na+:H+ antiporter subunit A [Rubricella aquisinus]